MSKPESKDDLSQEGKARKDAMLGKLQEKLLSVHRRRRQRTLFAQSAALTAVVVIAGLTWSFVASVADFENSIAEGKMSTSQTPRSFIASVGNVAGIDDKCVVVNTDNSAAFETIEDDELLALLAVAGQPSVLGKINGEARVIRDSISF